MFIRFTATAFRKLLSIYVFSCFQFGFEGRMWELIVSVPDHCLSFYFARDHSLGISPVSREFWKRLAKTGPNSVANSVWTVG